MPPTPGGGKSLFRLRSRSHKRKIPAAFAAKKARAARPGLSTQKPRFPARGTKARFRAAEQKPLPLSRQKGPGSLPREQKTPTRSAWTNRLPQPGAYTSVFQDMIRRFCAGFSTGFPYIPFLKFMIPYFSSPGNLFFSPFSEKSESLQFVYIK